MVVWTSNNYFRLYDLGRSEYKLKGVTRKFENNEGPLGKIRYCSLNSDGSKLGIIKEDEADNNFFVYDFDMDNFTSFLLPENRSAVNL